MPTTSPNAASRKEAPMNRPSATSATPPALTTMPSTLRCWARWACFSSALAAGPPSVRYCQMPHPSESAAKSQTAPTHRRDKSSCLIPSHRPRITSRHPPHTRLRASERLAANSDSGTDGDGCTVEAAMFMFPHLSRLTYSTPLPRFQDLVGQVQEKDSGRYVEEQIARGQNPVEGANPQ